MTMKEAGLGKLTKLRPLLIILAAVIGIILGQSVFFSDNMGGLIEPLLMILLFFVFLKIDLSDIGKSFKNVKFSGSSILLNFVWTPILAVILGYAFLGDSLDMRIGFLMLLVTPCTDWYLVFTAMSKGNVPLSTAILPLNMILQVILLPVYLFLFLGIGSSFDMGSILTSIVIVLVIPLVLANVIKMIVRKRGSGDKLDSALDDHGDNLQLLFLCLAVVAMFASQGMLIMENPMILVQMLIPLGLFFIVNFILAKAVGKMLSFSFDDTTSLTFITLARNSPLALAIAVAAFPESPIIALVLVLGPLIELPILSLASGITLRMRDRRLKKQS